MKIYPLAKPNLGQEEERAVTAVLRSGVLSIGPMVEKFERAFARKIGIKYACAVSSGTAGLHLALLAAGIKNGDEVITTPFSFVASVNAILYVGATPVFADIDPFSYNIDPSKIKEKITKKTKAILVVHIFGQSADMEPIMALAKKHNLKIIEDACESICARYKGKKVGTFGESAVFAFYPNKQMTTGEGGMVVTNSKRVYELCLSLRNQGRSQNMQWLDHERLGYNYRLDEMSAALGLAQLKKLNFVIQERRRIASWYTKYLSPYGDLLQVPSVQDDAFHTWFIYTVNILEPGIYRSQVIFKLQEKGISTKPYLPSIHLFSFYKKQFNYKAGDFPFSEAVSKNSLALPFYVGLKEADVEFISRTLVKTVISSRVPNRITSAKKSRIILIGGSGFIGAHLVRRLHLRDDVILTVIHRSSIQGKQKLQGVNYQRIDVSQETKKLKKALSAADYVVMLTWPDKEIIKNIVSALASVPRLKKILYLSSILVYSVSNRLATEKTKIFPQSEYEHDKINEESQLIHLAKTNDIKLCITRAVNIYGDRQDKGIINHIFLAVNKNGFVNIFGNGNQVRDYLHISDAVLWLERLLFWKQTKLIEIVNLASSQPCSFNGLVALVEEITKKKVKRVFNPGLVKKSLIVGDNKKVVRLTNYEPHYNFLNSLKRTYITYKIK